MAKTPSPSTLNAMTRPRGRDQVVLAVLDAATSLFSARGPAAVSLRDVAEAANVNVGLIHRHIGNKDELLAAVLERRHGAADLDALRLGGKVDLRELLHAVLAVGFDVDSVARLHARAILDGYDLHALDIRFPTLEFAFDALREELPESDARLRAAALLAFALGWRMFGATFLTAVGLDDVTRADLPDALAPIVDALIAAPVRAPDGSAKLAK